MTVPNATASFQDYRAFFSLKSIKPSSPTIPSKQLLAEPVSPHIEDFSDVSLLRKLKAFRGEEKDLDRDNDESYLLRENVESSFDEEGCGEQQEAKDAVKEQNGKYIFRDIKGVVFPLKCLKEVKHADKFKELMREAKERVLKV